MRRRLATRIFQHRLRPHRLVQRQRERPGQARFQRVDADLAIPLNAMPVPRAEQRPLGQNRQKQGGPCADFLVVEIAAMLARLHRRYRPVLRRRRHPHHPEKRRQRQLHPIGQPARLPRPIDRNMGQEPLREILRDRPRQRAEPAKPPIRAKLDRLDLHFEHIAGLSPRHRHRMPLRCRPPVAHHPARPHARRRRHIEISLDRRKIHHLERRHRQGDRQPREAFRLRLHPEPRIEKSLEQRTQVPTRPMREQHPLHRR